AQPPMFCMLLRKHLTGARLQGVETVHYERLLIFRFQTLNEFGDYEEKRLIVEIMGRHSNIILINHEQRIIDAITHVDSQVSRMREVLPAHPYTYPPRQQKVAPDRVLEQVNDGTWETLLTRDTEVNGRQPLARQLLNYIGGVSPQFCESVCTWADLYSDQSWSELASPERSRLGKSLHHWLTLATAQNSSAYLFYLNASRMPKDFHSLPLDQFDRCVEVESLSLAMETFYANRERENHLKQVRQDTLRKLNRQQQHLGKLMSIYRKDIQASRNYETNKIKGDLIFAHLWQIKDGMKEITVDNLYEQPPQPITIALNPDRTASQNAQNYYRRYSKNKTKFENATRFSAQTEAELDYLDTLHTLVINAENAAEIHSLKDELKRAIESRSGREDSENGKAGGKKNKRNKDSKKQQDRPLGPRRYTSSDGFTILVGRNNRQNDQLTLKTAQKDDLWFHLQKAPGTHVIVQTGGATVPDRTIEEAAGIVAWFSRSEKKRETAGAGATVPVDYCPASHVRKPKGARPGMVIYDNYNTVVIRPLDPEYLQEKDQLE
ncbi:MAG TPA: fibronectin/fibrinogen-binding protein, partial [Clostridiaceae bacterium]|nr:fibronectin/fibrinogen-binding protein [Clostridiaceae bacterium]